MATFRSFLSELAQETSVSAIQLLLSKYYPGLESQPFGRVTKVKPAKVVKSKKNQVNS